VNAPLAVFANAARAPRGALVARGCALVMIGLGLYLRVRAFAYPKFFLFDEHHFVDNARNYLLHRPDANDHPPLGKLIIAASIQLFGDGPIGWRAPALAFGVASIVAGAVIAARAFRSLDAGLIAAGLLCADGFMIAYSRAGLLDGYLATFALCALLLASFPSSEITALLGGALLGVATNIKFSGVCVLLPLLLGVALDGGARGRRWLHAATIVGLGLAVYVALYAYGLSYAHEQVVAGDVFRDTARLFQHHAVLTAMDNPWTSGWITWVLPRRPLVMGFANTGETVRALTSLGNLAIWWSALALAGAVAWAIAMRGVTATLAPAPADTNTDGARVRVSPAAFASAHGRAVLIVLSGAVAFLSPWVMTHRDSYIYHYLPTYACLVVLLGGYVAHVLQARPAVAAAFLLVTLGVSLFYAPVWSFMHVSPRAYELRLFLPSWR
jgi:dolichyl-phosphate-mannose--protein O-mannosyl transferase